MKRFVNAAAMGIPRWNILFGRSGLLANSSVGGSEIRAVDSRDDAANCVFGGAIFCGGDGDSVMV